MNYQLTLNFDNVIALQRAIEAVAAVATIDPTITKVDDGAAANENPARTKTNGKTAESTAAPADVRETAQKIGREEHEADAVKTAQNVVLNQALKICRALLDSGDAAKADLKTLRDELGVKKLSDVPMEGAAAFLAKVQALQDKHSA
jgi:hypothetical protein